MHLAIVIARHCNWAQQWRIPCRPCCPCLRLLLPGSTPAQGSPGACRKLFRIADTADPVAEADKPAREEAALKIQRNRRAIVDDILKGSGILRGRWWVHLCHGGLACWKLHAT